MEARFIRARLAGEALDRVLVAVETAVAVMLEKPAINRAVMGWLGTPGLPHGTVLLRSTTLWTLALGAGEGLIADRREDALLRLPSQLAFSFRGVLSFWTAGELDDERLLTDAREIATSLMLGFTENGYSNLCGHAARRSRSSLRIQSHSQSQSEKMKP